MIGHILHFAQAPGWLGFWLLVLCLLAILLVDRLQQRDWNRRIEASRVRVYARFSANRYTQTAGRKGIDATAKVWL